MYLSDAHTFISFSKRPQYRPSPLSLSLALSLRLGTSLSLPLTPLCAALEGWGGMRRLRGLGGKERARKKETRNSKNYLGMLCTFSVLIERQNPNDAKSASRGKEGVNLRLYLSSQHPTVVSCFSSCFCLTSSCFRIFLHYLPFSYHFLARASSHFLG